MIERFAMTLLLEARNICKSYASPHGKLPVLRGVDITIAGGEMVYITGRSGSGKSTLLHVLGVLDHCDSGDIVIAGRNVAQLSDKQKSIVRNEIVGFVFQFYNLLPELTVQENVMLPGIIKGGKGNKKKADYLLEQVELAERMKHYPHQLSGGEQQRVALVRALINEPRIVFCDEPTGNLDDESSNNVMEMILRLNRENKQAFCIVTHDEALAARNADALYVLKNGVLDMPAEV